jgi:hypothetical protein
MPLKADYRDAISIQFGAFGVQRAGTAGRSRWRTKNSHGKRRRLVLI